MTRSRSAAVSLLLVLGCIAVPTLAAAASSGVRRTTAPSEGSTTASLVACHVAVDQADRTATFAGELVATATSRSLEIRIIVLERTGGTGRFSAVSVGGWRRSSPGVGAYKYVKQVTNLPAPAQFRARVDFRWLAATGAVLGSQTRTTATCVQPDERAKLVVGHVTIGPSPSSANAAYGIVVRNGGRGPAGPFDVVLTVNGTAQPDLSVPSLPAGMTTTLTAVAPRCTAGSTVQVTLDPTNQVSEAPGGGAPKAVACPFTHGGTTGP